MHECHDFDFRHKQDISKSVGHFADSESVRADEVLVQSAITVVQRTKPLFIFHILLVADGRYEYCHRADKAKLSNSKEYQVVTWLLENDRCDIVIQFEVVFRLIFELIQLLQYFDFNHGWLDDLVLVLLCQSHRDRLFFLLLFNLLKLTKCLLRRKALSLFWTFWTYSFLRILRTLRAWWVGSTYWIKSLWTRTLKWSSSSTIQPFDSEELFAFYSLVHQSFDLENRRCW